MRLFCSFAYTGESIPIVTKRMRQVVDTLNANGYDAYCNLFDPAVEDVIARGDIKAIFRDALNKVEHCEGMVSIITSPSRSIGQIMEMGVAFHEEKPIYVFEHESAIGSSYLGEFSEISYTWKDDEGLVRLLATACKDFGRKG